MALVGTARPMPPDSFSLVLRSLMKKLYSFVFLVFIISFSIIAVGAEKHNYIPPKGYVPDAKSAIRIALAVWEPIYGKEEIQGQAPYKAKLNDGIWTVTGSLLEDQAIIDENGQELVIVAVGEVALIEIVKDTGCILRVTHGE